MRILPLTAFALLFCAPAKADKFWLVDPKVEQNAPEGSSPNLIEGVLIAESDEGYHVRIVGGEIVLPKKSVYKIEKDDLTLEAIFKTELQGEAAGKQANEERRVAQDARQRDRNVRIAEAAASRSAGVVDASATAVPQAAPVAPSYFDPVVGVSVNPAQNNRTLMRDVQLEWKATGDRRYLQMLRLLRRI